MRLGVPLRSIPSFPFLAPVLDFASWSGNIACSAAQRSPLSCLRILAVHWKLNSKEASTSHHVVALWRPIRMFWTPEPPASRELATRFPSRPRQRSSHVQRLAEHLSCSPRPFQGDPATHLPPAFHVPPGQSEVGEVPQCMFAWRKDETRLLRSPSRAPWTAPRT